jgi:hypothetical protein
MNLPWKGRDNVTKIITDIIENNIDSHKKKLQTKQFYQFPLISGGTGIGKSRTGIEAIKIGVKDILKNETNYKHFHIFIDLSKNDIFDNIIDSWAFDKLDGNLSEIKII